VSSGLLHRQQWHGKLIPSNLLVPPRDSRRLVGSSLVQSDEARLPDEMFARLSFDIPARRILTNWQAGGRKCQQPEVIVMRSVAARWAWPAIPRSAEIIDSLLQSLPATVPVCALRERGAPPSSRRDFGTQSFAGATQRSQVREAPPRKTSVYR